MLTTPTREPLTDEEFARLGSFLEKTTEPRTWERACGTQSSVSSA